MFVFVFQENAFDDHILSDVDEVTIDAEQERGEQKKLLCEFEHVTTEGVNRAHMSLTRVSPWGWVGEELAAALPRFSLDMVHIICQYITHKTASSHRSCPLQPIPSGWRCHDPADTMQTDFTRKLLHEGLGAAVWTDFAIDVRGCLWMIHSEHHRLACYENGKQVCSIVRQSPVSVATSNEHVLLLQSGLSNHRDCITWARFDEPDQVVHSHKIQSFTPIGPLRVLSCDTSGTAFVGVEDGRTIHVLRTTRHSRQEKDFRLFSSDVANGRCRVHPRRAELYVLHPTPDVLCDSIEVLDSNSGKHLRTIHFRSENRWIRSMDFDAHDNLVIASSQHLEFYEASGKFITSYRYLHEASAVNCQRVGCIRLATFSVLAMNSTSAKDEFYCVEHRSVSARHLAQFRTRDVRVHPDGSVFVLETVTGSLFVFAFVDPCTNEVL